MKLIRFLIAFIAIIVVDGPALAQKSGKATPLRLVLHNVDFAKEKSAIRPNAAEELSDLAKLLKKNPSVTLEVGAHTDASGSTSYNLRLSQQRAQAVRSYLVKKGIADKRLTAKGYGESKPINRCKRGVRCSDAEKQENRRIELLVQGLPADSATRAPWLILGGLAPAKPAPSTYIPVAKKVEPYKPPVQTRPLTETPTATTGQEVETGAVGADYFPELSEGKANVPQPLPYTFIGYTIEVVCTDKPLPAGHPLLRKYEQIFLRQDPGGPYCYYIGAFHTLTEAQAFCRSEALPKYPKARVAAFANDIKKYY